MIPHFFWNDKQDDPHNDCHPEHSEGSVVRVLYQALAGEKKIDP